MCRTVALAGVTMSSCPSVTKLEQLISNMSTKRFRVAFSFAGEKRAFVANVAAILAKRFGEEAILYDKYHEAEFARHDLGIYLPKLYGEQSDLIVPVLSRDYDPKRWTGWEWLQIYGLLTRADGYRVMPCRFELANADGLSPAAGFIELDNKTPEEAATLILERLALNEAKPKKHYLRSTPSAKDSGRDLVFISYSHKDKVWHGKLRRVLDADPEIRDLVWDDTKIHPSAPYAKDIDEHVARARIMIMLGSEDYFREDSGAAPCETGPALAAHNKGEMDILWFPVRTFDYAKSPVGHIMAATGTGAAPLETLSASDQKKALHRVLQEVRRCLGIAASPDSSTKTRVTLAGPATKKPLRRTDTSIEIERAATSSTKSSGAVKKWQEKLEFLQEELAIAASPAQKFELKNQIDEAKAKIAELAG